MDSLVIYGIDPGSTSLGVGKILVDPKTRDISSIEAYTVSSSKEVAGSYIRPLNHDELDADGRMSYITPRVLEVMKGSMPDLLVFEEPFMNRSRPMAYGVLLRQVLGLSYDIRQAYPRLFQVRFSVQSCKASIGASGIKGKDVIKEYMREFEGLKDFLPDNYEELSEHAIDAILVAYTGYLKIIK